MKILIVDDTSMMRFVIREILVNAAEVESGDIFDAASGREAIRRYKLLKPDLVFLDIRMPDLTGIQVLKEIINYDPSAKVFMITASGSRRDVIDCVKSGALGYIVKPPSADKIKEAVRSLYVKVVAAINFDDFDDSDDDLDDSDYDDSDELDT